VSELRRAETGYEEKLVTRSEAISLLLAELAGKQKPVTAAVASEEAAQDINVCVPSVRIKRMLTGKVDGQLLRFPLFRGQVTIGRTKDNDIQLKVGYVSRRHAVIQTDAQTARIVDQGSKNGIRVNSKLVSERALKDGDSIVIGNARFRYEEHENRSS